MTRSQSILTNREVEELSSIKKFPAYIGATDDDMSTDIFSDFTLDICKESGIIQLRNLLDPGIVYSKFHSEAIGETWQKHHDTLAELISAYADDKKVLEIGGSDSQLALRILKSNNKITRWTIIDPVLKYEIAHEKLAYIKDFFKPNIIDSKHDMIVHSHVLEHIVDPVLFLHEISLSLNYNDYHIFSVPALYTWLKNKMLNTITFEHTLFLTEKIIDYLLSLNEFKIIKKIYYKKHSIFYVTQKQKVKHKKMPNKYKEYKKMYLSCINYYKQIVDDLNKKLEKTDKSVYLFGAAFVSQYLIILGLNTTIIKCILDNSELKNAKRLYGTSLFIKSPNDVDLENSVVILKAGEYKEEIKRQLLNINKNIQFYE